MRDYEYLYAEDRKKMKSVMNTIGFVSLLIVVAGIVLNIVPSLGGGNAVQTAQYQAQEAQARADEAQANAMRVQAEASKADAMADMAEVTDDLLAIFFLGGSNWIMLLGIIFLVFFVLKNMVAKGGGR